MIGEGPNGRGWYSRAVSLEYHGAEDDAPPFVSALGEYEIADAMVRYARKYGIPIVERPEVARALLTLDAGDPVPPTYFRIVAIILNEVDRILSRTRPPRSTTRRL